MSEAVRVSSVETSKSVMAVIEAYFRKGQYAEITQAIGLHSILMDPQHTKGDQARLYRAILNLIKDRINAGNGKSYAEWYAEFPKLMEKLVTSKQIVTDRSSLDVLSSHYNAFGAFTSLDDFFFFALDDRKLSLDLIITYIEKTVELHKGRA